MTPAIHIYNIQRVSKRLFWTYVVQSTIVSILALVGFVFSFSHHNDPFHSICIIGGATIVSVLGLVCLVRYKRRLSWHKIAIILSITLSILFLIGVVAGIVELRGLSDIVFLYCLFMLDVNLAFCSFLIKLSVNTKKNSDDDVDNPMVSRVLYSIAVYSICIEIGVVCAILVPQKVMAIIGAVILALISLIVFAIFDTRYDEEHVLMR